MILLDSLYINESGGLELLKYLVESIEKSSKIDAFYLFDDRSSTQFINIPDKRKKILKASQFNRYKFYLSEANNFKKILCFGNIPPLIRSSAIVYTYFHNINLLVIPKGATLKERIFINLKKIFIKTFRNNTDKWIVQTENTKNALIQEFSKSEEKILIIPFFNIEDIKIKSNCQRNDYIFVSKYFKQKKHDTLLKVWNILFDRGYSPILHLTLSDMPDELERQLTDNIDKGVNIVNHGYVLKNKLGDLYSLSKATIYPSINESLGLGVVEAFHAGCDIIGADLPYVHSICVPSAVFDPYDVKSIVDAVILYESGVCPKSKIKVCNEINRILLLLN